MRNQRLLAGPGSSAEATRRDQRGAAPHFFTKRVADPNMIPVLVAAGVEFGAVKVWHKPLLCHARFLTPDSALMYFGGIPVAFCCMASHSVINAIEVGLIVACYKMIFR